MISGVAQRWRDGRDRYRPAGETINTRRYEVAAIDRDGPAKAFVRAHHYSGSYPAARFRFGLYRGAELAGVAVFSHPAQPRCLDVLPGSGLDGVELGRFVLLDDVPANGETWFLARCFELLRDHVSGVVSFSDPMPREGADGSIVFPGHIGTIYQAHNAAYLGRSKPRMLRLLPDGTCLHPRALAKLRRGDRGWRYVAELLEAHGAERCPSFSERLGWLERTMAEVTREVRHSGNHKYAWTLHRRDRRHLPRSLPYPKAITPISEAAFRGLKKNDRGRSISSVGPLRIRVT